MIRMDYCSIKVLRLSSVSISLHLLFFSTPSMHDRPKYWRRRLKVSFIFRTVPVTKILDIRFLTDTFILKLSDYKLVLPLVAMISVHLLLECDCYHDNYSTHVDCKSGVGILMLGFICGQCYTFLVWTTPVICEKCYIYWFFVFLIIDLIINK